MSKFNKNDQVIVISDCKSKGLMGLVRNSADAWGYVIVDLEDGKTATFKESSLELVNVIPQETEVTYLPQTDPYPSYGILFYTKSYAEDFANGIIWCDDEYICGIFKGSTIEECVDYIQLAQVNQVIKLFNEEEYYLVFRDKIYTLSPQTKITVI